MSLDMFQWKWMIFESSTYQSINPVYSRRVQIDKESWDMINFSLYSFIYVFPAYDK